MAGSPGCGWMEGSFGDEAGLAAAAPGTCPAPPSGPGAGRWPPARPGDDT
jgi:hypothetical protein